MVLAFAFFFASPALAGSPKTLEVQVVDRKDIANSYTYVVPGYISSSASGTATCGSYGTNTNCIGSAAQETTVTPGFTGSYQLTGATLTLKLPDGRLAIVNCSKKFNFFDEWDWNNQSVYRSCRVPMVSRLKVDFRGDNAKLSWSVSIDDSKMATETYKIIAVLDAPQPTAEQPK